MFLFLSVLYTTFFILTIFTQTTHTKVYEVMNMLYSAKSQQFKKYPPKLFNLLNRFY